MTETSTPRPLPHEVTPASEPSPGTPPDDDEPGAGGWPTSLVVPVAIIAIAIGLIGAIVWVSRQEQDAGGEALAGTSIDAATLPATVPYRELAGAVVVDVTFGDGSRTVPMILDTGAPMIVSEGTAQVFGSGSAGTISTTSVDGEVITSDVVTLSQISIGDARFLDVGAVVGAIEPGNEFYCLTEAGFIGASLMQTGVWRIDPVAGHITIASSLDDIDGLDGAIRLDFDRASSVSPSPLVHLPAGEGLLAVLLDTGSDGWLAVSPGDLAEVSLTVPDDAPAMEVLSSTLQGIFGSRVAWTTADIGLGGTEQELPIATIDTLPQGQGYAGIDFFRHFAVTVDWEEDAVYLEPLGEALEPSVPPSASVAWDDGFVVGSRVLGEPGAEALELDTAILAIDGRDVTRASFDDYCRHLLEGPAEYEMRVAGEVPTTVQVVAVEDFFSP